LIQTRGMKMKKSTKTDPVHKLAKKAGFVIWDDCDWAGDRVGKVDWASDYDKELAKFYRLVQKETIEKIKSGELIVS